MGRCYQYFSCDHVVKLYVVLDMPTSIYFHVNPGDEFGLVRSKEHASGCHILCLGEAAHGHVGKEL